MNNKKEEITISPDEKLKAAYALNLCTVSVGQIIDYNDVAILEQEYEAILNNLNLEAIPKDEALLNILKQLLDVITFFRIFESDKKIIERNYQHKMKNAIWNAVPNFGLLLAGSHPIQLMISLASQIGIGYMNYRREKADNNLEYDYERFQLERSAIEQFNGLQRELFDTAWRLADKYHFPDKYRLTEKQIKQYNSILMDSNLLRKYERLNAVSDCFVAYPPFWFQFGNTANKISRDESIGLDAEIRKSFRLQAVRAFETYWNSIEEYHLLREDQIAAACALEYTDILIEDNENNKNTEKILRLLNSAVEYSGNNLDVLQLCVIAYARIGELKEAEKWLRYLANEDYNINVNSQLLSGIYINKYLTGNEEEKREAENDYKTLYNRLNCPGIIIPWKENALGAEIAFVDNQRELLIKKYRYVIKYMQSRYTIRLGKILPGPKEGKEYPDAYFDDDNILERTRQMESLFSIKSKCEEYNRRIKGDYFAYTYIDIFNELFKELKELKLITDFDSLISIGSNILTENRNALNNIHDDIANGIFGFEDYKIFQKLTAAELRQRITDEIEKQIFANIYRMETMVDFSRTETAVFEYCAAKGIPEYREKESTETGISDIFKPAFGYDVLGEHTVLLRQHKAYVADMLEIINGKQNEIIKEKAVVKFLVRGDVKFDDYFSNEKDLTVFKSDAIAVIDDKFVTDSDLIISENGIRKTKKGKSVGYASFDEILQKNSEDSEELIISGMTYKNKNINIPGLIKTITELSSLDKIEQD